MYLKAIKWGGRMLYIISTFSKKIIIQNYFLRVVENVDLTPLFSPVVCTC